MAPLKVHMGRGPGRRSKVIASQGHRCKICIQCGKKFDAYREKEDAKVRFSKEETSRFVNEEGRFSCGNHRRDQVCNDCFYTAVANENEHQAFRRSLDRAMKGIWKKIYLKEGDKVPWSEDDEEDDEGEEVPSENVQRQTERASSSSLSREKACAYCGKVGNLDRCARCKVTFYCSRSHQAADYAKHKAYCQAPKTQPTNIRVDDEVTHSPRATREEDVRGGNGAPNEQPPTATWLICAHRGIRSDKLKMCSRCKCAWYCSQDHQRAHFPDHKFECKVIADAARTAAQPPAVATNICHPHIMSVR